MSFPSKAEPAAARATTMDAKSAAPAPPARGEIAKERFAATQEWLKVAPGEHHSLQLFTVKAEDVHRLESFLARAAKVVPKEDLYVYSVKIDGHQHYRAAYGNFGGPSEALVAEKELATALKAQHPYRRSFERMRSQNRQ